MQTNTNTPGAILYKSEGAGVIGGRSSGLSIRPKGYHNSTQKSPPRYFRQERRDERANQGNEGDG